MDLKNRKNRNEANAGSSVVSNGRTIVPGLTILLFFEDFERDSFVRGDRFAKRVVKPLWNMITTKQKVFGFQMWFRRLGSSLVNEGFDVRINDYATAAAFPKYPVGIAGYPWALNHWALDNPILLGPGMFDHPLQKPNLFDDPRFRLYLVTCEWNRNLFGGYYGFGRVRDWFGGIDTKDWPSTTNEPKQYDFLIYDKVRWDRGNVARGLLEKIEDTLTRQHLTWTTLKYKGHDHKAYRKALKESRALLFLCEHETQGMAYQEAMASGLPVLAWDPGFWQDPLQRRLGIHEPIASSSVPYFDDSCGVTFYSPSDFDRSLQRFLEGKFHPREFVERCLNPTRSASLYASSYFSLLE